MFKKLALATAAAGCLGLTALSPLPVEASILQMSAGLASAVDTNIEDTNFVGFRRCYWAYNRYGKLKRYCKYYDDDRHW